jgi:putative copper resistance protein D
VTSPQFGLVACRFAFDSAALFLWGAALFLATLVPEVLRAQLWRALSPWRQLSLWAITIATTLSLPLHSAIIADGWSDALNLSLLIRVACQTSIGLAWWCQMAGCVILLQMRRRPQVLALHTTTLLGAWLLASLTISGHTAAGEGWRGSGQQINMIIHLFTVGAWLGALPVVWQLQRQLHHPQQAAATQKGLMRFSAAGHVVVVMVMISGLINVHSITGSFLPDWNTPYRCWLWLKIAVVMAMMLLAIVNRYCFVPRMRSSQWAGSRFNQGLKLEIALSLITVLLVAGFGMLDPN